MQGHNWKPYELLNVMRTHISAHAIMASHLQASWTLQDNAGRRGCGVTLGSQLNALKTIGSLASMGLHSEAGQSGVV
jgi:hypothetical protein